MQKTTKLRLGYLAATVLLLGIEVVIALFVHDAFVRPYLGDVLVVILLYTAVRVIKPVGMPLLSLWILLFAGLVEVSQLLPLVEVIGLDSSSFFRTIMGTSFAWEDLLCYGAGCALTGLYDRNRFHQA